MSNEMIKQKLDELSILNYELKNLNGLLTESRVFIEKKTDLINKINHGNSFLNTYNALLLLRSKDEISNTLYDLRWKIEKQIELALKNHAKYIENINYIKENLNLVTDEKLNINIESILTLNQIKANKIKQNIEIAYNSIKNIDQFRMVTLYHIGEFLSKTNPKVLIDKKDRLIEILNKKIIKINFLSTFLLISIPVLIFFAFINFLTSNYVIQFNTTELIEIPSNTYDSYKPLIATEKIYDIINTFKNFIFTVAITMTAVSLVFCVITRKFYLSAFSPMILLPSISIIDFIFDLKDHTQYKEVITTHTYEMISFGNTTTLVCLLISSVLFLFLFLTQNKRADFNSKLQKLVELDLK